MQWQNRSHFYAVAAQAMRRILVDRARLRASVKRGGRFKLVSLGQAAVTPEQEATDLIALDDALGELAAIDPRKVKVVEMRYFAGLSVAETAKALDVSEVTVMRDWSTSKAWLLRALTSDSPRGNDS
jgi:RNA polymerase sigma-70 factor (ECF subfamily)